METEVRAPCAGSVTEIQVKEGDSVASARRCWCWADTIMEELLKLWQSMGIANMEWGQVLMMAVGCGLIYLAIAKKFEPLLLVPIGFGALLSNIPVAGIGGPDGMIGMIYSVGVETGIFPLLIFMGVGALTDFGALIAAAVDPAARRRGAVRHLRDADRRGRAQLRAGVRLHAAGRLGHRHHRRRRRPDRDLPGLAAGAGPARRHRRRRLLVHGAGADHPAADHARADHQKGARRGDAADAPGVADWSASCFRSSCCCCARCCCRRRRR
jgi:hypothetical protein